MLGLFLQAYWKYFKYYCYWFRIQCWNAFQYYYSKNFTSFAFLTELSHTRAWGCVAFCVEDWDIGISIQTKRFPACQFSIWAVRQNSMNHLAKKYGLFYVNLYLECHRANLSLPIHKQSASRQLGWRIG